MTYAKPLPEKNRVNEGYFNGLAEGKLMIQRCDDCSQTIFPPAPNCPACLSKSLGWVAAGGKAEVWSAVTMHQKYFASFAEDLPYKVLMVKLEEGPLMVTAPHNPDEHLAIGDAVEFVFDKVDPDVVLPKVRPSR